MVLTLLIYWQVDTALVQELRLLLALLLETLQLQMPSLVLNDSGVSSTVVQCCCSGKTEGLGFKVY